MNRPNERPPLSQHERSQAQYSPSGRFAYLGWWEGDAYRTVTGRVENLSFNGAMLLMDGAAPREKSVFLSLVGAESSEWFAADLVEETPNLKGGPWVRLVLKQPLPYEVFKKFGLSVSPSPGSPGAQKAAAPH